MKPFIMYTEMDSPMGSLSILSTDKGVCKVQFGSIDKNFPVLKAWSKKALLKDKLVSGFEELSSVTTQISQYFNRERELFDFSVDVHGTCFQKKVWKELKNIQYGETKSYKEIAQAIGAPKAVRAVGSAVNRNPLPIIIPCHRVIGSNGSLVGYNGGIDKKEKLLHIENALEKIS